MTAPAQAPEAEAPMPGRNGGDATAEERRLLFVRPPPRVSPRVSRWRAAAYSRFVALMKVVLPTVALALVVLIGIWPYLQEESTKFRIGFSALKARDAEGPRMTNPRFVGLDDQDRPFTVTADLAHENGGEQSVVELEMPKADLTLDDGTWLVLTSNSGIFKRDERELTLSGAATLFHDSGYEIRSPSALIDLATGEASSNQPVAGQGPFGELQAEGFHLRDKGRVIEFTGKARLVLFSEDGGSIW